MICFKQKRHIIPKSGKAVLDQLMALNEQLSVKTSTCRSHSEVVVYALISLYLEDV